jgi:hypothetical protein
MPVSNEERFLALSCGDQGRLARADNLLSQCARLAFVYKGFRMKTAGFGALRD